LNAERRSGSNVHESTSFENLLDEFSFKPTKYKANTVQSKEKNSYDSEKNPID